jgi:cis-3-alkyl-4-acyloxetan-2-one decarboxylase
MEKARKIIHQWLRIPYSTYIRSDNKVKKPRATVLFIHGIGSSGSSWQNVIDAMPTDVRVITIDLIGFGESPKPFHDVYSAKHQAASIMTVFLRLRITSRITIVGHSLGSLVAIEIAKRYPLLVKSLILCSPPLYRNGANSPAKDRALKNIYKNVQKRPDKLVEFCALAVKYRLIDKTFSVTDTDVHAFMWALEAAIINQTSLDDAERLKIPTHVIRGRLDPVVVPKNLRYLAKQNEHIHLQEITAGHEVRGKYVQVVTNTILSDI